MVRWVAWAVCVVGTLAAACRGGPDRQVPAPKAVAVVNGEPIFQDAFQAALDDIKSAGRGFFIASEGAGRIKRELLERMIDAKLLTQEARKRHIVLDPKVVEASIEMIARQYPPGGLEEELHRQGKSIASYREQTEASLLLHKLLNREVVDRIAVSRQEVERYYQEHRQEFRKPEEVRVRQIVTRTEEEAERLRKEILRGASFAEMARKHSLGPEAAEGGDLGYFPRGRMPPAIEEACFKLWPSQLSRVVASPYGFHLFKQLDHRPARELSLQEAWPEIERKLTAKKTTEAEAYYIRTLRDKASIDRDIPLLDRLH